MFCGEIRALLGNLPWMVGFVESTENDRCFCRFNLRALKFKTFLELLSELNFLKVGKSAICLEMKQAAERKGKDGWEATEDLHVQRAWRLGGLRTRYWTNMSDTVGLSCSPMYALKYKWIVYMFRTCFWSRWGAVGYVKAVGYLQIVLLTSALWLNATKEGEEPSTLEVLLFFHALSIVESLGGKWLETCALWLITHGWQLKS